MEKGALFTMEQTCLQCIECGYRADLLAERNFRCPQCGDLYDVIHDFGKLNFRGRAALLERFDKHTIPRNAQSPFERSGVWRFHELVMPYLPMQYIVSLGEGLVPILPAGRNLKTWIGGGIDLWLILEGQTMTGSFKDFGMTVMMSVAQAAGVSAVGCASTGDTSASLAAYAAAAGINCFVLLPANKVTPVQLVQPLAHGARVITVPGNFDDCMRIMQELVTHHGVYPGNSLNPARIEGHQATVFLIAQFFDWHLPDWFAVPIGNGSNVSSVGKGIRTLRELELVRKNPRILGCQAEAANPLVRAWDAARKKSESWESFVPMQVGETTATAARIGNPVSWKKVIREIDLSKGCMTTATEQDLNEAVYVAGKDGFLVCPQTGMALAGVRNAIRAEWITAGQSVVVVSTATGLKFAEVIGQRAAQDIMNLSECSAAAVAQALHL